MLISKVREAGAEGENCELEASLGYIVRLNLRTHTKTEKQENGRRGRGEKRTSILFQNASVPFPYLVVPERVQRVRSSL